MPVVGEFHQTYWSTSDTKAVVPPGPGVPGYPMWQSGPTTIVLGSAFGGLVPFFERIAEWCRRVWRFTFRVSRLTPTQCLALERVLQSFEHPGYPIARHTVRKTATTLGFNRSEAWLELGRALKRSPGESENTFRHLESVRLLRFNLVGSTLSNPQANLMVELAYQEFAAMGK